MRIKFKRLHEKAKDPIYASEGAACFDLHSIEDDTVYPKSSTTFRTGLAFEIPQCYAMMVYSRSGHGFKNNIRLSNCVGVIDADYRGEVMISIYNDGILPFRIAEGMRIGQGMVIPIPYVGFDGVDELSQTERGDGGFGSTGQ